MSSFINDEVPSLKTGNNPEMFLTESSLLKFKTVEFIRKNDLLMKSVFSYEYSFVANKDQMQKFLYKEFNDMTILSHQRGRYSIENSKMLIAVIVEASLAKVTILTTSQEHSDIFSKFDNAFTPAGITIEWMFSSDGNSINIPLNLDKLPIDEMYPFLKGETLESYYERFISSNAPVLLLIGPPGTAKTTFIRGLMNYAQTNAIVTYDQSILEKDYVFSSWIENEEQNFFIIEDSDLLIKSRESGNSIVSKFLNVSDGLVSIPGKKMIFSTNLTSTNDIDFALTREGRCFDILEFRLLTRDEAVTVANKIGVELKNPSKDSYSIAEIYHEKAVPNASKKRKFGFGV